MRKIIISFFTLLSLAYLSIVFYYQENIVHPQRRTLQEYHYAWLEKPYEHSMQIIRDEEHKDVLIVKRDEKVELSKRSQKIFDELLAVGYAKEQLKNNGILLMYHGKNGRKEDLLPVAERYVTAGFTCVLVDLPAHGESLKTATKYGQGEEQLLYEYALRVAQKHIKVHGEALYFWGMSLGGAYAISSAQPDKKMFADPQALVLVATFDKLSYVLKEKSVSMFGKHVGKVFYRGLEFSLKFFYDFDPEKVDSATNAERITVPVFMLHGKEDKLIGYKRGEELFKHFDTKDKVFHLDEKGNHHNILVTEYPFYLKSILFLLKIHKVKSDSI